MSRSPREILLLADAGATHTRAVVATSEGHILGSGQAGPANPFAVGQVRALINLKRALNLALTSAGIRQASVGVVTVGSAGVAYDGRGARDIERELRKYLPGAKLQVLADARIALEGALGGEPGVVIVCGTGSIVLGRGLAGRMVRIGGWGAIMGDEGSAQWLGREALRLAAQADDGTGLPTALRSVMLRHFGLADFEHVVDLVYAPPATPRQLGELAPLVTRAARRGDRVARGILRRGAQALAQQAATAVTRLRLHPARISYQGAMFRVGELFLRPLRAELRRCVPKAKLVPPQLPPLGGAFLLAMRSCGQTLDRRALNRFRKATRG